MGSTFALVADNALCAENGYDECQVCAARDRPVYLAPGMWGPPGVPPTYVYVACADCILSGQIAFDGAGDIVRSIRSHAADPAAEQALLARTPRLPRWVQDHDWPLCCGRLAEYIGEPTMAEAEALDRAGQYWEYGPSTFDTPASALVPAEKLAVLGAVSAFRCRACARGLWIFQHT